MTKLHLSHFEKVAGLFILVGVFAIAVFWVAAAMRQGWLEPRVTYYTKFSSGEGLYAGLDVLLAGIRVGRVSDVELLDSNEVLVEMSIIEKYKTKIRQDSRAMLIRPLVLGERAVEISMGSSEFPVVAAGSELESRATFDIMTVLSGRMVNESFSALGSTLTNLAEVMTTLLEKEKLAGFVKTIDRIDPLIHHMDQMAREVTKLSRQVNRDENIGKLVRDLAVVSYELNQALPMIRERAPAMADDFETLVGNMADLSEQFKEMGPDLPVATQKTLEALDETVVLLKAAQKSFFFRSHVKKVREEDAARKPASP